MYDIKLIKINYFFIGKISLLFRYLNFENLTNISLEKTLTRRSKIVGQYNFFYLYIL